jgi:hypothetical protein
VQVAKAWATDEIQATQTQSDTDSVRPWPSTHIQRRPQALPRATFWWYAKTRPKVKCEEWTWQEEISC